MIDRDAESRGEKEGRGMREGGGGGSEDSDASSERQAAAIKQQWTLSIFPASLRHFHHIHPITKKNRGRERG